MKNIITVKLDPEALAIKISKLLSKPVDINYIRGILTPKGRKCSDQIKASIILLVNSEINKVFDLDDQISKILKAL